MCGSCNKKRKYAGVTSNVPRPETHPDAQGKTPEQITQESMRNATKNANGTKR